MATGIDHIVFVVADLARAIADWQAAGYTVVPGGEHTNGLSENALVAFADGTYFEIIAFHDPSHPEAKSWAASLLDSGDGLVDYALRTDDLDAEVVALRQRGFDVDDPVAGGRTRPDGQRIEWRTIHFPHEASFPFYCHDETPRSLRVPEGEQAVHANGMLGVRGIQVPVADIDIARTRYASLTGDLGFARAQNWRFGVGNQFIELVEGSGDRPLAVQMIGPHHAESLLVNVDRA